MKKQYLFSIVLTTALLSLFAIFKLSSSKPSTIIGPSLEPNTVEMTENGFNPERLTVKVGTTVTFINKDKAFRWPASDLHPTHTIYPEFDPKQPIEPGKKWSFTFNKSGDWNYHDHLSPLLTGKIIVIN